MQLQQRAALPHLLMALSLVLALTLVLALVRNNIFSKVRALVLNQPIIYLCVLFKLAVFLAFGTTPCTSARCVQGVHTVCTAGQQCDLQWWELEESGLGWERVCWRQVTRSHS